MNAIGTEVILGAMIRARKEDTKRALLPVLSAPSDTIRVYCTVEIRHEWIDGSG